MIKLFISHSNEDISLVKFIIHLLEFYHINSWSSFSDSDFASVSNQNFNTSFLNCDKLLVLVTANVEKANWMKKEISMFNKCKPQAEIIPLVFNKNNLKEISPILGDFQPVDFTEDLTDGFKKLFSKFGVNFLDPDERRMKDERRSGEDRRKNNERRSKNVTMRLFRTFCSLYSEISQSDEDAFIDITNQREFEIFLESVKLGAKKFLCLDESENLYNTNYAVSFCLNHICSFAYNTSNHKVNLLKAKDLLFMLAQELTKRYVIRWKDRRKNIDRRTGCERRELCETLDPVWSLN